MNNDWLKALKPGDTVLEMRGEYALPAIVRHIDKHIDIGGRKCFSKKTGKRISNYDYKRYGGANEIVEATPERLAEIEAAKNKTRICEQLRRIGADWKELPLESLEQIIHIIEGARK